MTTRTRPATYGVLVSPRRRALRLAMRQYGVSGSGRSKRLLRRFLRQTRPGYLESLAQGLMTNLVDRNGKRAHPGAVIT